jgi:hypothetical protein
LTLPFRAILPSKLHLKCSSRFINLFPFPSQWCSAHSASAVPWCMPPVRLRSPNPDYMCMHFRQDIYLSLSVTEAMNRVEQYPNGIAKKSRSMQAASPRAPCMTKNNRPKKHQKDWNKQNSKPRPPEGNSRYIHIIHVKS